MGTDIRVPCGIMFHHFHGQGHSQSQGSISADQLDRMIDFIGSDRIVPAQEWQERAVAGLLHERDVCLTFDDALRCQADIALPVLEAHGLTAFWFVYSSVFEGIPQRLEIYRDFRHNSFPSIEEFYAAFFAEVRNTEFAADVERNLAAFDPDSYMPTYGYLSRNDRKFRFVRDRVLGPKRYMTVMDRMMRSRAADPEDTTFHLWITDEDLLSLSRAGHVIGLHSYTHPTVIEGLPEAAQRNEYQRNFDHIVRVTGRPPRAMAHPCNSYDATTLKVLAGLGIDIGFRANMDLVGGGKLEFPRLNHVNLAKVI